ncbi:MAG: InlB B-repeat-containing protein, partial [Kiritimatiellae bacterium]|nr:InlB B-repeat-containing protein [Kiritimatiellia bacterium]
PLDYSWARRYESRIQSLQLRLASLHKERDPQYPNCVASGCDYNQRVWREYLVYSSAAGAACNYASQCYEDVLMRSRTQTGGYIADGLLAGLSLMGGRAAAFSSVASVAQGAIEGGADGFASGTVNMILSESLPLAAEQMGLAYNAASLNRRSQALFNYFGDIGVDQRVLRIQGYRARARNATRARWNARGTGVANAIGVGMSAFSIAQRTREMNDMMSMLYEVVGEASRAVSLAASAARRPYKECKSVRPRLKKVEEKKPITPVSLDPNEMAGPEGIGERRFVKQGEELEYTIYFENDAKAQTAPLDIVVDNPVAPWLDLSSFRIVEVAFANQVDVTLKDTKGGSCEVKLGETPYHVSLNVSVNHAKSLVRLEMHLVDKNTKLGTPEDPYAGILQPNDNTHCGEGHLTYRIKVRDDAPAYAVITNSATIVFDTNDPITTDPAWWNTVAQVKTVEVPDGEGGGETRECIVGAPYGELPSPGTREGYTFGGWHTGPNGSGRRVTSQSLVEEGDEALYEYWLANAYEVRFNPGGGRGAMDDQPFEFGEEAPLDANAFEKSGYSFAGWATNEQEEAVYADCEVVSNLVSESGFVFDLYATWSINKYTVKFDAAGGTGGWTKTLDYGSAIVAPTVTRTGYTFKGWTPVVAKTVPVGGATYTAQWTANKYTVTFDANGGTGGWTKSLDYGSAIAAPAVTRTGYTFKGWTPAVAATVPLNGATYKAQWTANKYTVKFDAAGGSGGWAKSLDYGSAIA